MGTNVVSFEINSPIKIGDPVEFYHPDHPHLQGVGELMMKMGNQYQIQTLAGPIITIHKSYVTKVVL